MSALWSPVATGFLTAFTLILAIGAQNAFVLRQGIRREHVFPVCLICALSDAVLIAAGVAGFGAVVTVLPSLPAIMTIGGAGFLFVYGALRFRAAVSGGGGLTPGAAASPLWPTLATCMALTWLNPHVYLDTFGLIGAVSTGFTGTAKLAFGIGAVSSSVVFFFGLGYGARLLAPLMRTEKTWRILDIGIGVLMWALAIMLIVRL